MIQYNLAADLGDAGEKLNGTVWTDRQEMIAAIQSVWPDAEAGDFSAETPDGVEVATWGEDDGLARTKEATKQAASIRALLSLLDDDWYDDVEGEYGCVPTWGPETERVTRLIGSSCGDGDIVSWDTRSANVAEHVYLRRQWTPAETEKQCFYLQTEAELAKRGARSNP